MTSLSNGSTTTKDTPFRIGAPPELDVANSALEALLLEVYVGQGFTHPDVARVMFTASAVRARGDLLLALEGEELGGMIVVVWGGSAAARFAKAGEAELALFAVRASSRGRGLGAALLGRAIEHVRVGGSSEVVLWTQPEMSDAQRLYQRAGFQRKSDEDFEREGRKFLMHRLTLDPART
jgi:ribosomal protein S18 acetylase RimI-like enzyme